MDTFYVARPIESAETSIDPQGRHRFNVRKPGSDERDQWLALYQIEDR